METPRNFRGKTSTQVGQNLRNRLFTQDDSGIFNSPTTGIPQAYSETTPDIRHRRRIGQCSPIDGQGRVHELSNLRESKGKGWKKFWLIWAILLTVSSSLVAIAWTYFPENKVVRKSQEYVMASLIVIIAVVILTGILKLIFQVLVSRNRTEVNNQVCPEFGQDHYDGYDHYSDNTFNDRPTNMSDDYACDSDKMPDYSTPHMNSKVRFGDQQTEVESTGQKSEIIGQNLQKNLMSDCINRTNGSSVKRDITACTNNQTFQVDERPNASLDVRPTKFNTGFISGHTTSEYPVRRTFSGGNNDVWNEYIRYFENISELNNWNKEKSRRVLLSTFRGQAETYAYGMPLIIQREYDRLKQKMEERFGHTAMKEKYVTEAKLRKRQPNESMRDFGQAIEDLFRRAYPNNPEIVEKNAIKSFLDKCGQAEDFRLAVKRMRPKTLQEAVYYAMQEECLRAGGKDLAKETRSSARQIYEIEDHLRNKGVTSGNEDKSKNIEYRGKEESRYDSIGRFSRGGMRYQRRPYPRYEARGRGRPPMFGQGLPQNFRTQEGVRRDSEEKPLN